MSVLISRVLWPVVMGLITGLAVWSATHSLGTAFAIALLPMVLGAIDVFRSWGYAVAGLSVIFAVFVAVVPQGTRARLAANASEAIDRIGRAPPNAAGNNESGVPASAAARPPRGHRHHTG